MAPARTATYADSAYDVTCFTDASLGGRGAYAQWNEGRMAPHEKPFSGNQGPTRITACQKMWMNQLVDIRRARATAAEPQRKCPAWA